MHSKMLSLIPLLILAYLSPTNGEQNTGYMPHDPNLLDDHQAKLHYRRLFEKRAEGRKSLEQRNREIANEQVQPVRSLSWLEQIKNTILPSLEQETIQYVRRNPLIRQIEREIEMKYPEPERAEELQFTNSTWPQTTHRRLRQDDEPWEDDMEIEVSDADRVADVEENGDIDVDGGEGDQEEGHRRLQEGNWSDSDRDDESEDVVDDLPDPLPEDDSKTDDTSLPDDDRKHDDETSNDDTEQDTKQDDTPVNPDDVNPDTNNDATDDESEGGTNDDVPDDRPVEVETKNQFKDMCKDKTDAEGTCEIKDEVIEVPVNSVFKSKVVTSLVFNNTKILCAKGADLDEFCEVTFELTTEGDENATQPVLSLVNNSEIRARAVYITLPTGRLIIDGTSSLNTDGTSRETLGTDTANKQAASHVGQGGFCGDYKKYKDLLYGRFDKKAAKGAVHYELNKQQLAGSIGMNKKSGGKQHVITGGGGRIHIDVDSLYFQWDTSIRANGFPTMDEVLEDDLNGGSGGSIYLKTSEVYDTNNVSWWSEIEAMGGNGKNKGFGGAGGTIYYDGTFDSGIFMAEISGGLGGNGNENRTIKGCDAGASGTAYWSGEDSLMLDNRNHDSDKVTPLNVAKDRNNTAFPQHHMIVQDLYIGRKAILSLKGSTISKMVVPHLFQHGSSTIKFDFTSSPELLLKYEKNFYVSGSTLLDFSKIKQFTRIQPYDQKSKTDWGNVNLGTVKFSRAFQVEDQTNSINLLGNITDVRETKKKEGYIQLYSQNVNFFYSANINVQNAFIFANQTIHMYRGSRIESTIQNDCAQDGNKLMYQCMNFDLNENNPLTFEYILNNYNQQYGWTKKIKSDPSNHYAEDVQHMRGQIIKNWRVYLLSLGSITIQGSKVIASRVGLCANDIKITRKSRIDGNFMGCTPDSGKGNLPRKKECSGAGGSHGGFGGAGSSQSTKQKTQDTCKTLYPLPYYYGREARFEGSGGTSGDTKKVNKRGSGMEPGKHGGSGGGIIWITTPKTIEVQDSTIEAEGQWGKIESYEEKGSGGGSGGSIQVQTQNLKGNGIFSVRGGDGSKQGGGGGGGGRFSMNFLRSYRADSQPEQSHRWEGKVEFEGGWAGEAKDEFAPALDGQNGTIFSSKCFPGHSGPFCQLCPTGTFKQSYSFGTCMPCVNKPANAYYDRPGEVKADCHYQCNFWESSETNKECLNPLSEEFEELGGLIPFMVLMFIFFFVSLIMFITFTQSSKDVKFWMEEASKRMYSGWQETDQGQERGKIAEDNFSLNEHSMWAHTHRMYFVGSNSIGHPWIIPKDFPTNSLAEADKEKFIQFIDGFNSKFQWTQFDGIMFATISCLYYPLSKTFHDLKRKQNFDDLQSELYKAMPPQFWGDNANNKTIRLGCSEDHILAYIDFLDYSQDKQNWKGLKIPMDVLLAGAGTYNHPYHLDYQKDPYVKSLVLMNQTYLKDKLPPVLENLNSDLGRLSFYKLHAIVETDLMSVVKSIEKSNKMFFNHFNVKCVLYLCENTTVQTADGGFSHWKQVRKSFPLESIFIDSFPKVFTDLLSYVKLRLHSGKSEMRLLLSFKRYSRYHQMGTRQRIQSMMQLGSKQGSSSSAYKALVQQEQSVLFSQADTELSESKITHVGKPQAQADGDKNEEGEVVEQLLDARWRAFSHSIEDCKSFEKAIRKPRNACQHKLYSLKKILYAIYLLFVNHQGSPSSAVATEDFTCMFMLYSIVFAMDMTNLINFTFHIFRRGDDNFENFGWVFFFVLFGVPYLSPLFAFISALKGSPRWLKLTGNMNSMCVCFNYPLTLLACVISKDDPYYLVFIVWMMFTKCVLSFVSGRIRMYLYNPKYGENLITIREMYTHQLGKRNRQIEILGVDAVNELDRMQDDPSRKLLGGFGQLDVKQMKRKSLGLK